MAAFYLIAAAVFWVRYRREHQPLERQQLKWLTRGTLLAVLPFTLFYVIPFLLDATRPALLAKLAVLSLVILPLTFSWAIVRYRLMDVDLIFKRGVTYTLATACAGRPLLRRHRAHGGDGAHALLRASASGASWRPSSSPDSSSIR